MSLIQQHLRPILIEWGEDDRAVLCNARLEENGDLTGYLRGSGWNANQQQITVSAEEITLMKWFGEGTRDEMNEMNSRYFEAAEPTNELQVNSQYDLVFDNGSRGQLLITQLPNSAIAIGQRLDIEGSPTMAVSRRRATFSPRSSS